MQRSRHSYVGLTGLLVAAAILNGHAQRVDSIGEWGAYGGDLANTKYSSLDQINRTNVQNLRIAWRHAALDPDLKATYPKLSVTNYYRATPLMIDGVLFLQNGVGLVEALEPSTGKVVWAQEAATRGRSEERRVGKECRL